ncbi:MAG: glutamate--tRNA ligase [Ardenticatenales bacterium]
MPDPSPVRVRIAPSPTGFFHVGNARTAIFNWLFARRMGGTFIWRVEDTDRSRFVPEALDDQRAALDWLGITPDEGPFTGGEHGPYMQSERLPLYTQHVDALLDNGLAYRCFCTPERLAEVRKAREIGKLKGRYDRHCRNLSEDEIAAKRSEGARHTVRLKVPLEGVRVLTDVLRGEIAFDLTETDDPIILKGDGWPTYHLAVVVDDEAMAISHVLRADEWIPSAPIHLLLYEAFGWTPPVYCHVPLVLSASGKGKLSKREGGAEVREYRAAGYLPEAMFNYLALLGWAYSGDEEIFTPAMAAERFTLDAIKVSPAAWNAEKLDWMNGHYIRALAPDDLATRLTPFLADAGIQASSAEVLTLVPLIQERITTLQEAVPLVDFFWATTIAPAPADLVPNKLTPADVAANLRRTADALAAVGDADWTAESLEAALRALSESLGVKPGPLFQPIRVAVTGKKIAPPLFETLAVVGRDTAIERVLAAAALLDQGGA